MGYDKTDWHNGVTCYPVRDGAWLRTGGHVNIFKHHLVRRRGEEISFSDNMNLEKR
jgi:hypothetical protein